MDRRAFMVTAAAIAATSGLAKSAASDDDLAILRDEALKNTLAWQIIQSLTTQIGARPVGSPMMDRARDWGVNELTKLDFKNVHVEAFAKKAWFRGEESAAIVGEYAQPLHILGLGGSPPTPDGGLTKKIVVFPKYQDLLDQPENSLAGKIAIVTQAMERTRDVSGYRAGNIQRSHGPAEAEKRGASAYLTRSVGTDESLNPHTGMSRATIPSAALSTRDSELIEQLVRMGNPVELRLNLRSTTREIQAYNVVGEIPGLSAPNETVIVGGHLDSWDVGTGAIDDASGVAIMIAAAKLATSRKIRRTVRVVLWGSEEQGGSGQAYAAAHLSETAQIIVAGESDAGADSIWAAALPNGAMRHPSMQRFGAAVVPLHVDIASQPAEDGGSDIEGLIRAKVPFVEFKTDLRRYFDFHHTDNDRIFAIDPAQLAQNVAVWALFLRAAADSDVDFRKL